MTPFMLILSAPSGGGKTTIAKALLSARKDLGYSVSATTRPKRARERDGVDYHFVNRAEFERRRDAAEFLEWAEYGGHLYGTLAGEVDRLLRAGRHVVLDIEVQGARLIRDRCQNVISVFIIPPSIEVLVERLGGRNTERPEEMERRLRQAIRELEDAPMYDYVVVNADRTQAVAEVAAIIDAEMHRPERMDKLASMLNDLRDGLVSEVDRLVARNRAGE